MTDREKKREENRKRINQKWSDFWAGKIPLDSEIRAFLKVIELKSYWDGVLAYADKQELIDKEYQEAREYLKVQEAYEYILEEIEELGWDIDFPIHPDPLDFNRAFNKRKAKRLRKK